MSEVYNIIEKRKLDVVSNPIEKSQGLPNECYTSEKYTQLERKKLFEDKWAVVGVASSLLNKGDAKPFDLLGIPIIILRDDQNKIRVFHNVCSHRGHKILQKHCKIKNVIRCPYHSWSYNLEGKLISTPHIGGVGKHEIEDFDKSCNGLKEVRSYVWMDLIFVNISAQAEPFDEFIKPLDNRWSEFLSAEDRKLIRHPTDHGYFQFKVKSNWKFAIENYCESYHLPWIHPDLNSYSKLEDHYTILANDSGFAGQGSLTYNPNFVSKEKFNCFPNWPKGELNHAEYIALFPNVMLGIHRDHYFAFWLEPINQSSTIEHMEVYYVGDESAYSDQYKEIREENSNLWFKVLSEDINAIEGMQAGRNSPSYTGGKFSPVMDTATHHFHKWVATNII